MRFWLRVGDAGEYESFGTLDEAIAYMNELHVGKVTGWVEGGPGVGLETVSYWGLDFISLFVGDRHASLVRRLNPDERAEVEYRLVEAYV